MHKSILAFYMYLERAVLHFICYMSEWLSDSFMQTSASSELWERCSCDSLPLLVFSLFQLTFTWLLYMYLFAYLYIPMCYYEVLMSALFFSFSNCICWYYDQRFNKIYKEKGLIILWHTPRDKCINLFYSSVTEQTVFYKTQHYVGSVSRSELTLYTMNGCKKRDVKLCQIACAASSEHIAFYAQIHTKMSMALWGAPYIECIALKSVKCVYQNRLTSHLHACVLSLPADCSMVIH